VARWEPDSRGRLREAAFELFSERGYDETTVAEIAERAGVTERTFFRQFADKREVLFAGSAQLQETLVSAVTRAAAPVSPIDAIAAGFEAVGTVLPDVETARRRQAIIVAHPDLQERELIKFDSMSTALAEALRARGLAELPATLTAQVGMAVFRTAFERWIDEANERGFAEFVREALGELRAVTT
jgi:AcrR family transcriptional regulator